MGGEEKIKKNVILTTPTIVGGGRIPFLNDGISRPAFAGLGMTTIKMRRRDYYNSQYVSPRQEKLELKKKEKKSFKKKILFLIIFILILAVIYGVFFSPAFAVTKIVVSGTNKIGESAKMEEIVKNFLSQKRFLVLSQKNILFLSRGGLKRIFDQKFDFETVEVGIDWPHTLWLKVKEKKPSLIWQNGEDYYTVFNDGRIKAKASKDGFELPLASYGTTTDLTIGAEVVSREIINYLEKLSPLFNFYFKEIKIKEFIIPQISEKREVKLITNENWYILFNLAEEPENGLKKVKTVVEQKFGQDREGLEYIDVRYQDKVYYK